MANDGIITRKDIIQDEALKWGEEYAKNVEVAIKANDKMVLLTKELARLYKELQKVQNNTELIKVQEEINRITREATQEAKKAHEAEIANEKVKQQRIKTLREEAIAEQKLAQEKLKTQQATTKTEEADRKANAAKEKAAKLTIEERVQNEQNNKVLKQAALEKLGLVGAYQKLNKERTEAKRKVMDLMAAENASTAEIKKAQAEFEKLDKKVRLADKAVGDFTKNVGNYPQIGKMTGMLRDLTGAFGIGLGLTAFAAGVKQAWNTVKEFDTAITELSAVTEIPKKQLGSLKGVIVEVSKTSVNSAVDVAKLAVELSKLGASTTQIEAMIETVDRFSVAMEASGEESASFLLGVMNSFGASAEEAERYGDVMAQAANISALGFEELKNSLKTFAPVANAANLTIERSAALTGVLVDNNLEATTAGTSLRSIFLQLAKSGLTYEQAMSQINGSTNKLATATNLFGKESATSALILAGNTDKLAEYEAKLNDSSGALQKLNETKMDSLENQVKALSSTWDGFILSIESGDGAISNFVKTTIKGLQWIIESLTEANKGFKDLQKEVYKKGLDSTLSDIEKSVAANAVILEARKKAREEDRDYNVVLQVTYEYYKKNKTALLELVEAQKQGFKESSIYSSGKEGVQKSFVEVNNAIIKQKKLIEELTAKRSETGIVANIVFGTRAEIKRAQDELEKMLVSQKNFQSQLDAYENFGSSKKSKPLNITEDLTPEEDDKAKKAREKSEKDRLARLKKAFEDEYKLRMWRLNRTKELNQEIVDSEDSTTDERIEAYLRIQELDQAIARETAEYKLRQLNEFTEGTRKLSEDEINTLLDGGQIKTVLTNEEKLTLEELQAKRDEINKRQEKNLQNLIDLEAKRITDGVDKELGGFKNSENKEVTAENDSYKLLLDQYGFTEEAEEAHQAKLLAIKNEYLKQGLKAQIDAYDKVLKIANISDEAEADAMAKSLELKKQLSELELDVVKDKAEKEYLTEQEKQEKLKELSENAKQALIELANVIFDAKIQKIDDEIAKNEEYYARQIELAGDDQKQKQLLEAEAEKKREELEKKKRKEQTKQAIFNKSLKIMEIGIATALGMMQAFAQLGPIAGAIGAALVGVAGAAQTAAVLATPIPKYKTGRKGGKEEFAILGDGGVSEVVERKSGGLEITPAYDTLYKLGQGDIVHKSVDDFFKSKLNSMNKGLSDSQSKMNSYQEMVMLNIPNNTELLEEMKKNTAAVKNSKPTIVQSRNFDINFELWKNNQTNWNR